MERLSYAIDEDIRLAATLPGQFYTDTPTFEALKDRVFARSWQCLGNLAEAAAQRSLVPRDLLPGFLDDPLLLARDGEGELRCLSNVCTHRGNILVKAPCTAKDIRCGYHSRRFDFSGKVTFMPEFDDVEDWPTAADNLRRIPFAQWAGLGFASLEPYAPIDAFLGDVRAASAALPLDRMRHDPSRDRDYEVRANWALYVDNYLEGFHIPFVHAGLNSVVDYGTYETRLHRFSSVQIATSKDGSRAAQYWWLFPNLMLNFYPWGLSLNLVMPQAVDRTRVLFRSFIWDASQLGSGAGADLDRVEHEDEAIVEAVQRGVRSRLYHRGRYSPTRERGVHHFHRLLCEFLG